ncbi:unnamed protein product, partial [Cylindrotheca closterium]
FHALDALTAKPDQAYLTRDNKLLYQDCRPTDSLQYTFMAKGMVSRLGDDPKPSMALLDRHVRCLDSDLDALFRAATNPVEKRDIALAGLANLSLWLGWLRSSECFDLNWDDVECLEPEDGDKEELPTGCGLLKLRLAPETKSDRSRRADVLVAYRTLSGLCIGLWYHRTKSLHTSPHGPVFCSSPIRVGDNRIWVVVELKLENGKLGNKNIARSRIMELDNNPNPVSCWIRV